MADDADRTQHGSPDRPPRGPDGGTPRDTVLLFADVSGYTPFIRGNAFTLAHATFIIRQLLDAVADVLEPRFRVIKEEGDAAFCAGDARDGDADLTEPLRAVFAAFHARRAELQGENGCPCAACTHIGDLDLKIITHRGEVLWYQGRTGEDLSGLPVIVLHRLAKNSVEVPRYLLWTDDMAPLLASAAPVRHQVERYDDIGAVPVSVLTDLPGPRPAPPAGTGARLRDWSRKMWLWMTVPFRRRSR